MLRLFGRPTLTTADGNRVDLSPTGWRLLAAVAAGPAEGSVRTDLAAIVVSTGKLSSLRKHVFEVRRVLDAAGLVLLDGEGDVLRLSEDIYCDVRDLRAARPRRAPREIYRGDFFNGGAPFRHAPWAAWLARHRADLLDLYVRRAGEALSTVDGGRAAKVQEARHLLKVVHDHQEATRVLMLDAARSSDAGEVQRAFGTLRSQCHDAGNRPDKRTTDVFHRLVGASQRPLGTVPASHVIDLPTIYVHTPPAADGSPGGRMLRSLLADVTIGLCRASLFRVIASDRIGTADSDTATGDGQGPTRAYAVMASVLDHVLGRQIVFSLASHPSREILWTERVEATTEFTVTAYNLLTAGVLRALVDRIKDLELDAFRLEADPGAYASYLAGYSSLGTLDLAQLRIGRRHLRRSMAQSPDFAPVSSALARSYQLEYLVTARGDQILLDKARDHSMRAIASDPLEARGFKALGFCDLFEKRFDAALENYAKAEQLNRNYAELLAEHANCLLHCGQVEEALAKIDYAMLLNPEFGDMYRWTKASAYFLLSRYEDALDVLGQMRHHEPAYRLLAATHALMGNGDEARIARMMAMEAYPSMTIEGWMNIVALKDPRHIRHFSEGMAAAGFQ